MTTLPEPTLPEPTPLDTGITQEFDEEALLADVESQVDGLEQVIDMAPLDFPRRLLLVHAHPDDETTATGTTMATYAAAGDLVTLVTCNRGELGEVVDPTLADLASRGPDDDRLGIRRVEELAAAMEALRVTDHRFLGGPGRWRDSGMEGEPSNADPRCFWQADLSEATAELVAVIRAVRPQVVITYDANGGYGHPDHIQAHRVTVAAVPAAADPTYLPDRGEPWQVSRVLATVIPRSFIERGIEAGALPADGDFPGTPDGEIAVIVDGTPQWQAKLAAMRAHRSQIDQSQGLWAMLTAEPAFAIEHFTILSGVPVAQRPAADVFDGVA